MASSSRNKGNGQYIYNNEDTEGEDDQMDANYENESGGHEYESDSEEVPNTQQRAPTMSPTPTPRSRKRPPIFPTPENKKGGKQPSWVWAYFSKAPDPLDTLFEWCICAYCNTRIRHQKKVGSTSTLARHLNNAHKVFKHGGTSIQSDQSQISANFNQTPGGGTFVFNRDRLIDEFGKYIVITEQPFAMAEHPALDHMIRTSLQPLFRPIPRTTMTRKIKEKYRLLRGQLIEYLGRFEGGVSVCCDLWKSPFNEYFLGVTCHWIDESWALQKRIIGFEIVEEEHNGYVIKDLLVRVFQTYHIHDKLLGVGVDNATNNTKALELILSSAPQIHAIEPKLFHERCVAHILNLCVQDGLKELHDVVSPIRDALRWIRCSDKNRLAFKSECIRDNLTVLTMNLDAPHRWGSTYKMLNMTEKYIDIITRLYNRAKKCELLTPMNWIISKHFCELLKIFDDATTCVSYVYQPSIHMVIPKFVEIATELSKNSTPPNPLVPAVVKMKEKMLKYFKPFPPTYVIATILDPRMNLNTGPYLSYFYKNMDNPNHDWQKDMECGKNILKGLYDKYSLKYGKMNETTTQGEGSSSDDIFDMIVGVGGEFSDSIGDPSYGELNKYYGLSTEARELRKDPNFDIFMWWKANEVKFPILHKIAKDILACPPSTVAIESAFSAGRRILTDNRGSLAPTSIRALICMKDMELAANRCQDQRPMNDEPADLDEEFGNINFSSGGESCDGSSASGSSDQDS